MRAERAERKLHEPRELARYLVTRPINEETRKKRRKLVPSDGPAKWTKQLANRTPIARDDET